MEKVRFGIIGLGNQGSMYAVHLFGAGKIENGVVTAMCDINPAKIEAIKNRPGFEDKAYFENYIEMLDSGLIDAALIEVPHYLHPEMVIACLLHDVSYCEEFGENGWKEHGRRKDAVCAVCGGRGSRSISRFTKNLTNR